MLFVRVSGVLHSQLGGDGGGGGRDVLVGSLDKLWPVRKRPRHPSRVDQVEGVDFVRPLALGVVNLEAEVWRNPA